MQKNKNDNLSLCYSREGLLVRPGRRNPGYIVFANEVKPVRPGQSRFVISEARPKLGGKASQFQGGTFKTRLALLLLFIAFSFTIFNQSFASVNVNLYVEGCNNNNICEAPNENNINCPNDCTSCNYNNVCELLKGETISSCPSDCSQASTPIYGGTSAPTINTGMISDLNVETGINYAIISWNTNVPTYDSVSWGLGDSYNGGIINGIKISSHHEITIENLSASTTYSYSADSSLPGYYQLERRGTFTTKPLPEMKEIPSVDNFKASVVGSEVTFRWSNPSDGGFYGVKIVRSPFFYPTDPSEGKVIYDGSGTYARDSDLAPDMQYYYSAFSYDKNLDYSSAVLTEIILYHKEATTTKTETGLEFPEVIILPIKDFIFNENDLELSVSSSIIKVYPFDNIKIVIDRSRFPGDVKSLVLRIQDPSGASKALSYGFSYDQKDKSFYAVVPNLGNKGVYPFTITSYGQDNKVLSTSAGFFDVMAIEEKKTYLLFSYAQISYIGIIIVVMFCVFLFIKHKK